MRAAAPLVVLSVALTSQLLCAQTHLTFQRDVAPIIFGVCTPCHHVGGSAPFPLASYQDVSKHRRQITNVTRTRFMPPWLPHSSGEFSDELRLTDTQIQTIAKWVEEGIPPGDLEKAVPPPPAATGWTLGTPDAVVQAAKPFEVPAAGPDVFWNFVLSPRLSKTHYIRAIEIRPNNASLIHHANIIVDRMGTIKEGFPDMEVTVPRNPLDFDGHFLFFKPGMTVATEPDGFAWRLDPSTNLILNTHMQPSGRAATEQPTIALYFTDRPPTHFPYLLQLENDEALDIPPGAQDFVVSDHLKLPIDTEVLAIYPHAHNLGKVLDAFATLPDGTRKWLIRIPNWDPHWQSVYRYRSPLMLPAETLITMRYHYDNSSRNRRNPNFPPKRVQSGNQASDEMAHLWLQVIPKSPGESRRLYVEAWARHKLDKNPSDYAANLTLGSLALSRFDALSALKPLLSATRQNPGDAVAHNLYGTALAATGRNTEAGEQFQIALRLKPGFTNARFNLAHALANAGKRDEAVQNLQQILKEYPSDPAAGAFLNQLSTN